MTLDSSALYYDDYDVNLRKGSVRISELASHLQAGLGIGKNGCVHVCVRAPVWKFLLRLVIDFASSDHRHVSSE